MLWQLRGCIFLLPDLLLSIAHRDWEDRMRSGNSGIPHSGGVESGIEALGKHREDKSWRGQPAPALSCTRKLDHAWSDPSLELCSPPHQPLELSTAQIIF